MSTILSKLNIATKEGGDALYYDEVNAIVSAVNDLIDFRNLFYADASANKVDITNAIVIGLKSKYTLTGDEVTPNIALYMNGGRLVEGTDYVIQYSNNDMIGTATGVIYGMNGYSGTKDISFAIEGQKYTLAYEVGDHGTAQSSKSISVLTAADLTLPTDSAGDYTCDGWYYDNTYKTKAKTGDVLSANTTLYAHWVQNKFNLVFNVNGITGVTAPATENVATMPDLTAAAYQLTDSTTIYEFGGWYKDAECSQAAPAKDTKITADMTLYAKWTKVKFTLSYNLNGHGTSIESSNQQTIPTLATPTDDDWYFAGWFTDEALTLSATAGTTLTADTTLYAKWISKAFEIVLEGTSLTLSKTDQSDDTSLEYKINDGDWTAFSAAITMPNASTTIQARLKYKTEIIAGGSDAITSNYDYDNSTLTFSSTAGNCIVTKDGSTEKDGTIELDLITTSSNVSVTDGVNTATITITNT